MTSATKTITTVETILPSGPIEASAADTTTVTTFPQTHPGLLVTKELDDAIADCKARVDEIAKDCKAKNRKFRDIEFDLENDKILCLYGLFMHAKDHDLPADVRRVTQIFDNPQFFSGTAGSSNDIIQGSLGDCWFLSALATVSTAPGLVEKFCVARDERVGVYGFIFFKDNAWVPVIIDDMLYTSVPKWEELNSSEQALYHHEKDNYNKSARKGGKSLFFAKSGTAGETWVPLIEKAYAKLHGNYSHLIGGEECEAIEDLTGGVSTILESMDILDTDRFWDEELTRANNDRLFGCSFLNLSGTRSGVSDAKVQGLIGNHSYSVLRAMTCNGKRFVVVRNPWGKSEWTGRWSDGSKEWTPEWVQYLHELEHQFGDDGQFVMEYSDWLECFSQIDRTLLFDESWAMSSQWLQVTCPPLLNAWSHGDVSYRFTLSSPTTAIIVLSQLDRRCFRDISGQAIWTMDFTLVREGELKPIANSAHSDFFLRSVHLEVELEEGNYIVYVRLERKLSKNQGPDYGKVDDYQSRKLSRILTQRAKSKSVASNFKLEVEKPYIPSSLKDLIKQDVEEFNKKKSQEAGITTTEEIINPDGTITRTTTTTKVERVILKADIKDNASTSHSSSPQKLDVSNSESSPATTSSTPIQPTDVDLKSQTQSTQPAISRGVTSSPKYESPADSATPAEEDIGKIKIPHENNNEVVIGLRVYTHKDVTCSVEGKLRVAADCED